MLCLVSTLAMATEMTCAKDDGKGTCIAATDPDGRTDRRRRGRAEDGRAHGL